MLPLAADEDLNGKIIRGLRRRLPDIDLVRVQDVGLSGHPDPEVLEWAATAGRVLITQDVSTMVGFAWDRVKGGLPMPGVIVRGKGVTIRQAIDELALAASRGTADDFRDQVRFLPLS
jgi:predicted nuclease of predicted toxin-antitoxin system